MKPKRHLFLLTVENPGTRNSAEMEVLLAFAKRQPDGSKFYLHRKKPRLSPRKKKTNARRRKL